MSRKHTSMRLAGVALLLGTSVIASANAGAITDPANDFIATSVGIHDPSLNVLSLPATSDGAAFRVRAIEAGDIATFTSGYQAA
jgi:hypothetical protein